MLEGTSVGTRFYAALLLAVILFTTVARAQEFPRWESFGGFSYANVNLGPQASLFNPISRNYYGADLAFSFNPQRNIRLLLMDWGIQGGKSTANPFPFRKLDLLTTQALFGPQVVFRGRQATVFANSLVGVTNTRLVGTAGGGLFIDLVRRTNLALGFGGGLDVNWRRSIAIRMLQADYIPTRVAGTWEKHYSLSTGVVFKFGYRANPRSARCAKTCSTAEFR